MFVVISMLLVVVTLLYFHVTRKYSYWSKRGIRHIPALPLIGSLWKNVVLNKPLLHGLRDAYNTYPDEKYFGIYDGLAPALVIRDLEVIKKVTLKDSDHFIDHRNSFFKNEDDSSLVNKIILLLKGQKWRDMRATLSPAFTGSKMRMMLPFMNEISMQVVQYLRGEACQNEGATHPIDLYDLFTRSSNDIIATCAFGMTVDSLHDRNNQFYSMGKRVMNFSKIKFIILILMPQWLRKLLDIDIFPKDSTSFFRNLVSDAMKYREDNRIVRHDMIDLLMKAKNGKLSDTVATETPKEDVLGFASGNDSVQAAISKRQWTDDELAAQALIFFLAGFDTIATALTFATHELAINTRVQERLRREIDACHAGHTILTYEVVQGLKYLDMVMSESLRKWPPAAVLDRECVKEYTFDPPRHGGKPYTMQPKDYLYIYVSAIHMDETYFPNPDEFDPERFSDERRHEIKPFTYLPFGSGPRNCIGSRFAVMEFKVILYQLILNFELVACEKTSNPILLAPGFKIAAANGSWITFKPRNSTN